MKLVNIIGPKERFTEAVSVLARSEVFQPEDAMSFHTDTKHISPMMPENPYSSLLSALEPYAEGLRTDSPKDLASLTENALREKTEHILESLRTFSEREEALKKELENDTAAADRYKHFIGLGVDMKEISECRFTAVRFGRMPIHGYERFHEYEDRLTAAYDKCSQEGDYVYAVFFSPKSGVQEMDRILSGLYFERIYVPNAERTIDEEYDAECKKIQETERKLEELKREKDAWLNQNTDTIEGLRLQLNDRSTFAEIAKYAAVYSENFILVGWIPSRSGKMLKKELQKIPELECDIENADPELDQKPPVLLRNNKLIKPFEMFTDMYGMPTYGELDPTPFVAVTYTLLFGIMFGDLGQGLLIALIGFLAAKFKNMKLGSIIFRCGISSALFGIVYGSFFGFEEALNPFYKAVFGWDEKPINVMDARTSNTIIYAAVGIGIALVMTAMLINVIVCIRKRNWASLLFGANGLPGLCFYTAAVIGLVGQLFLKIKLLTPVYIVLLLALPLVLIFLQEPLGNLVSGKKEKIAWGNYLAQSFFELFETLLSYVTNTMSFMRVGAFVLVHAGMMTVVFTLSGMTSGIAEWIIIIIGNIIVTALEALLVAIQVLRLEFYEMFSRFFEGGGRPFHPIQMKKIKR